MDLSALQIQQRITVRIVSNDSVGTGILALSENSEYIYVLTAKHVLLGRDFKGPLVKSAIILDRILTSSNEFTTYQVKETDAIVINDSEEDDFAIIVIPATEHAFDTDIISKLHYIDSDFGLLNCSVRGFPYLAGNTETRSLSCLFDEFRAGHSDQFLIHTVQHLETFILDANTNVRGLSGGGVFFNYDGKNHLLGIVIEFTNINSFYCIRIGRINSLLQQEDFPLIPVTSLIVDERIKKAIHSFRKNEVSLKAKIRDTIGDLHLTREQTTDALKLVRENQFFLLYGNAGVGKSSFAKEIINKLTELNEFELLLFNGEQFSKDSIDGALQSIGIDLPIEEIVNNTAFKNEKIFWIESLEKLVETGQIDAFNELLELAKKHDSIKIVITIRSYMLQQFFLCCGWNLPAIKAIMQVPLLTDNDLRAVASRFPSLQPLLNNPKILHLLKIPFYLNYAVAILPALNSSDNLDESTFKSIIWQNVIDKGVDNRSAVFESICVKRAKEMTLYTAFDADRETIQSLYRDNLIAIEDDELKERYTPSHDVLEDWALIRFIKRNKRTSLTAKDFFHNIGNEPAIRRAFRLWLGEVLQDYNVDLKNFIQKIITSPEIEKFWRDEIFISILRSDTSDVFFQENEVMFLENECRLSLKFIHLLKTACKQPADGFSNSYFPIIIGSGWGALIRFIYTHKEHFVKYDHTILVFLIEWKSKLYNGGFNFPPETREAGLLLLEILERNKQNYNGNINRQSLDGYIEAGIRLSFTLTGRITVELGQLLLSAQSGVDREVEKPNYRHINFYEKVIEYALDGSFSNQLCIYLPDLVISLLKSEIAPKPKKESRGFFQEDRDQIEDYFGLPHDGTTFFPPSSYQTPLYYLLKHHLVKALNFIIETINNATEHFVKSVNPDSTVEVELTLNDGSKVKQAGNHLIWQMYRGLGQTPHFLQSILMSLEKYLFELAEKSDSESKSLLQATYNYLYLKSTSVATTAVLASVGMRFPNKVGEAILPVLSSKYTIQWDEIRYMNEHSTGFTLFKDENDIHEQEREESNKLPHRRLFKGLNNHIVNLLLHNQSYNDQIFKFLDHFHEEAEGDDQSVLWLKSLSEMDVRRWQVTAVPEEPGKAYIYPTYEGKVKEFVEEGLPEREQANVEAGYSNWIDKAYKKDITENYAYDNWKKIYLHYTEKPIAEMLFAKPGTLAVVGLRDFPEQLKLAEKGWAINTIYKVIADVVADRAGHDLSLQRSFAYNLMDVTPCLSFLPFLFKVIKTKKEILELKRTILYLFLSDLHDHELFDLLNSIRNNLWEIDTDFSFRCVCFMVEYAGLRKTKTNWSDYYGHQNKETKDRDVKRLVNSIIKRQENVMILSQIELNNYTHYSLSRAFLLIPPDTKDDQLILYSINFVRLHINYFNEDTNDRSGNFYQDRIYIRDLFSIMMLYLDTQRGKEAIDLLFNSYDSDKEVILRYQRQTKKQEFVNTIVEYIIRSLDRRMGTSDEALLISNFWLLWSRLHTRNQTLPTYHFASLILMEITWKEDARSWKPLVGKASVLKELIKFYGEVDLSAVLSLMATIGDEVLMPHSINLITEVLKESPFMKIYLNSSMGTKFIQRCFFNHGKVIKQNGSLLNDFFTILDIMVDNGSSEAYLIRENLITFKAI